MHVYKCRFLKVLFSAKFHCIDPFIGDMSRLCTGEEGQTINIPAGPQWAVSSVPITITTNLRQQEMLSTEGPHHINIASCCLAQYDLTTFQLHQRIKWLNTTTSEFWFSSFCCWKWLPSHNNMNSGPILARAREQRDYRADVCCVLLLLMTTAQHQMTTASTRLVFISDISPLLITTTIVVAAVAVVVIRFLCCSSIVRLRWGRDYNYNYNHWIIRELQIL